MMRLKSNTINKPLRIAKILICVSFLLFTACSKDGDEPGTKDGDQRISFRFNIAPPTEAAIRAGSGETSTRVTTTVDWKTEWEDGDEIGIFASIATSPASTNNPIHNVKLTYNKSTGEWRGNVWWPDSPVVYNFWAYYPYDDNGGNLVGLNPLSIPFEVKTDQRAAEDFGKSHLLTGSCTGVATSQTAELTFNHAAMMVQVALGNVDIAIDPNNPPKVKLLQVNTTVSVDVTNSASSTVNTPADITMYRVEQPEDDNYRTAYTYRALLPVQNMQVNKNYFRIYNGDVVLEGGKLFSQSPGSPGHALCFTQPLPLMHHTASINSGSFLMGSPPDEPNRGNNETQHKVNLTKSFRMSKYLITNMQYATFLNDKGIGQDGVGTDEQVWVPNGSINELSWSNSSRWEPTQGNNQKPVTGLNWYGAKAYAEWAGGKLPTEAQWEYACRAGTDTPWFAAEDEMVNYAWWSINSGMKVHLVGEKKPNPWGLYDITGNVWEWCRDAVINENNPGDYGAAEVTNPLVETGDNAIGRGGGYLNDINFIRSASRSSAPKSKRGDVIGFRIIFEEN